MSRRDGRPTGYSFSTGGNEFTSSAEIVLWPTDAAGRPLIGYWRCRCGSYVPPNMVHQCTQPLVVEAVVRSRA